MKPASMIVLRLALAFGLLDDVVAVDDGGAIGRFEDGGEHAEGGGFAGAVGAQEAVDLAGLALKTDVIDGADFAALLVLEALGQASGFDHMVGPSLAAVRKQKTRLLSLLRKREGKDFVLA